MDFSEKRHALDVSKCRSLLRLPAYVLKLVQEAIMFNAPLRSHCYSSVAVITVYLYALRVCMNVLWHCVQCKGYNIILFGITIVITLNLLNTVFSGQSGAACRHTKPGV